MRGVMATLLASALLVATLAAPAFAQSFGGNCEGHRAGYDGRRRMAFKARTIARAIHRLLKRDAGLMSKTPAAGRGTTMMAMRLTSST